MQHREIIINNCKKLLEAYRCGKLGQTIMPEDSNPDFSDAEQELRLAYFTLPMALNYQRDSYKLWEAALKTYNDEETRKVFDISFSAAAAPELLRKLLTKHKVALQPNKHIQTWQTIAKTIHSNWGLLGNLMKEVNYDFLELQKMVQQKHKKRFPYLSGPKIFHYWSFIIQRYGKVELKNSEYIEIAPDTHITQCSVKLGVISSEEVKTLTREQISARWREVLHDSGITPIEMHPPLWFWSRNGFLFEING